MSRKKQVPPQAPGSQTKSELMREGEVWLVIPGDPRMLRIGLNLAVWLKYLFEDKGFYDQVEVIRCRFRIPLGGRPYPTAKTALEVLERRLDNDLVLRHDRSTLKSLGVVGKRSLSKSFRQAVTKLRRAYELPCRFQYAVEDYVINGKWPKYGAHASRTLIRYWKEQGETRLAVEVYGDTKEADWRKAWRFVERLQGELQLPGGHLFRHKNRYLEDRVAGKRKRVDPVRGQQLEENENAQDYVDRYRLASRARKRSS